MIKRTFKDIPDGKINEADQQFFLISLGWSQGYTWDDLLLSKRVLIISEAGAGKTYECHEQLKRLRAAGEPAFFLELATLATDDLHNLLDEEEEARLEAWKVSQSEVATFFLDSIDELKLTSGSFERALKQVKKCIGNQLHRARIVTTTRPISFDEQLMRNLLPVPSVPSSVPAEETFAKIAMREHEEQYDDNENKNQSPDWRLVALMPLSDEQIVDFCRRRGVNEPVPFFEDLRHRNALEFARRPQDLLELCADWCKYKRIRTHQEQVATNIRVKLLPRDDRAERGELSVDKAFEGASRLALAAQVMRCLTIRHNAASDTVNEDAALDPARILSDWNLDERKALLERPLFVFASYGRVRFHHRSIAEYLAAERLIALLKQGMPFRTLKRLLFAETKGKIIVRPSKRPVAGWLALQENRIFELLRDNEPAVLLNEGDPESLPPTRQKQALRAYAERYGVGGWRDLKVPSIQLHRFASEELADEIKKIWHKGIENPDVRGVLINLIKEGRIKACADIVFDVIQDTAAFAFERIIAIDALVALDDNRLGAIADSIANNDNLWSAREIRVAVLHLFPKYISIEQLLRILRRIKRENTKVSDFSLQLSQLITGSEFDSSTLESFRDGLVELVSEGLEWREESYIISSNWSHLSEVLAAICKRGLDISHDDKWLYACVLALRLHHRNDNINWTINPIREQLNNLNAKDRARLFWIEDALLQSVRKIKDPWKRFTGITIHGAVQLRYDRDIVWVRETLGDTTQDESNRSLILEVAIRLFPDRHTWKEHVEGLKSLVVDEPLFVQRLNNFNNWLEEPYPSEEYCYLENKQAEQKAQEELRKAKDRAAWIQFWKEVANQPENAFSPERFWNTAWNLWRVMSRDGDYSKSSGWNRHFIEKHFNTETADRLRSVLMRVWRSDKPTLPSERSKSKRNTFLERWQLGLAAIYAEAEDHDWATKLNVAEAQLAARYAPIELNGLPQWMEALVTAHPDEVEQTLGNELSWELNQPPEEYSSSSLLQVLSDAPRNVAKLFLPRLESWLETGKDQIRNTDDVKGTTKIWQVTHVILKHGDTAAIQRLQERALQRLAQQLSFTLRRIWLSVLMKITPSMGVERLVKQIEKIEPSKYSEAVTWFASLFGDSRDSIDLSDEQFTPQLLLQLLRLAYRHVRLQDDALHHGEVYSPDVRDDAEMARNNLLTALFNTKGEDGLAAKLEIANDSLCVSFKDRLLTIAEEKWAQEIDAKTFSEEQAVVLDRSWEVPASTNEDMFEIMKDRLSDIDELLLGDASPREEWAEISEEKIMRRAIARELSHVANSVYTVVQEAVTADEKETDIRLRSLHSEHEAVIELKLGEKYSATELRDTIEKQLVRKYMAAKHRKAGALVVTLAKKRSWQHPVENRKIKVDELLSLLRIEADRVQQAFGDGLSIYVHFLDLRPRLPIESKKRESVQK